MRILATRKHREGHRAIVLQSESMMLPLGWIVFHLAPNIEEF
jgi:hypothetical protein